MSWVDQVSEMQFGGRTSAVMGMSLVYQVRLVVQVGEISSVDWVG